MKFAISCSAVVALGLWLTLFNVAESFLAHRLTRFGSSTTATCRANGLWMSGRGGGRGSGGRSSGGGRGGRGGKNVRLDQRDGARPLTRAEIKAKEIYDATKEPEVPRLHASADRVALAQLAAGQQLRGRIVSVKEFGLFVDIGAKRDGLVHVKDISKDYFIQNHEQKFIPGQDIDVWIKFVEEATNKLGLQMFPLAADGGSAKAPHSPSTVSLDDFEEEDEVSGVVVRVSNYGVFVDIGAGVEAFLHRRKMRLTKKMRSFKPWEIAPLGSKVDCYIHELDHGRKRISLTTYAPADWDEKLPLKSEDDGSSMMVEDEEELGGSAMADNLRALERTLSLSMGDDEDDLGDDDDDEGEELTAEEIKSLTMGRSSQPQIVIDDFGGSSGGSSGSRRQKAGPSPEEVLAERRSAGATTMEDQGEEVSLEELFQELCGKGRDYVTVRDVKKWDYLQDLLADGDLSDDDLAELFEEAGAVGGKLVEDQFDDFIDLLADSLGLEEEGGMYDQANEEDEEDEEEEEDEGGAEGAKLLMDDFAATSPVGVASSSSSDITATMKKKNTGRGGRVSAEEELEDEDEELDFGLGFGDTMVDAGALDENSLVAPHVAPSSSSPSSSSAAAKGESGDSMSLSDHYEKRSKTSDLFQYVFTSVAGKKGHVVMEDVMKWDFVQALLKQQTLSEASVAAAFNRCQPRQGKLGAKEFEALVSILSDVDSAKATASAPLSPLDQMRATKGQGVVDLTPKGQGVIPVAPPALASLGADEDDEEAAAVAEAFAELSGGKSTVSFKAVAEWDLVAELIEEGTLSREDFEEFYLQAGARSIKGSLDVKGFEALLDLLAPLTDEYDDADADEDEDEEGDSLDVAYTGEEEGVDSPGGAASVTVSATATAASGQSNVKGEEKSDEEDKPDDDDQDYTDEEEGELLSNVFANLANGKTFVSAKDMQNWDIVLELMGEGLLTDDVLREKMAECQGYTGKGVPLEGFDQLVDKLVELYGELEEFDGRTDEAVIDASGVSLRAMEGEGEGEGDQVEGDADNDDYIDIDTEEEFEAVAKGKDYVTFADLRDWELIQQLRDAGEMSDESLREVLAAAGVEDENKMGILAFEAILDVLSSDLGDEEDEEDEAK